MLACPGRPASGACYSGPVALIPWAVLLLAGGVVVLVAGIRSMRAHGRSA